MKAELPDAKELKQLVAETEVPRVYQGDGTK
jgi:hypothetical protein